MRFVTTVAIASVVSFASSASAEVKGSADGTLVTGSGRAEGKIDYANARPMPLPNASHRMPSSVELAAEAAKARFPGRPQMVPATEGNGKLKPTSVPKSRYLPDDGGVGSQEYGSSNQPYTTSRAPNGAANPYNRTGKLFFTDGGLSYVCSASLVKKGVIVTAAHCVANFGQSQFHSNFVFIPGYTSGNAPFGTWNGVKWTVATSYYNGSDPCTSAAPGIVCQDDIGVITLGPQSGAYPGTMTGTYGYLVNGGGFTSAKQALITQLGYPVNLDGGELMERTDSQGSVAPSQQNNTVIGSLQTGGSSGGPWLVNFGVIPVLSNGTGYGKAYGHNILVGVTSWGYTDTSSNGLKQMGASPFLSSNVTTLVDNACTQTPGAC